MTPQQQTTPTLPLWEKLIAFLMMLALASSLDFVRFFLGPIDIEAGNPVNQLVWSGFYAFSLGMILLHLRGALFMWQRNLGLLLILLIVLLSFSWSIWPEGTMRRAITALGTGFMATYFALRFSPKELLKLAALSLGVCGVFSLLFALFIPDWGVMTGIHEGRWRGVYNHKNILGRHMTLGIVLCLAAWRLLQGREAKLMLMLAVVQLVVLGFTQSATSLITLLGGLMALAAVAMWVKLKRQTPELAPIAAFAGGAALVLVGLYGPILFEEILLSLGKTPDLTGRTLIWQGVFNAIADRPLLGFGYDVFWDIIHGLGFNYAGVLLNWDAPHAHNGLLELALNAGLIGLVLFVGNLIRVSGRTLKLSLVPSEAGQGLFVIAVLFVFLLNVTEVTILRDNNIFWVLYLYTALRSAYGVALLPSAPR
jgi:exopolysaccharide production protein ExoQ